MTSQSSLNFKISSKASSLRDREGAEPLNTILPRWCKSHKSRLKMNISCRVFHSLDFSCCIFSEPKANFTCKKHLSKKKLIAGGGVSFSLLLYSNKGCSKRVLQEIWWKKSPSNYNWECVESREIPLCWWSRCDREGRSRSSRSLPARFTTNAFYYVGQTIATN